MLPQCFRIFIVFYRLFAGSASDWDAVSQAAIEEVDLNVKVLVGLFETTCPSRSRSRSSRDRGWSESQLKMNVAQPQQPQQQRLCSSVRSLASKPPVPCVPCVDPGLPRLSRKLYGKTHPLDRLTPRQRHAHPVFGTMWPCSLQKLSFMAEMFLFCFVVVLRAIVNEVSKSTFSAIRWCTYRAWSFAGKCLLWVGAWDFQLNCEMGNPSSKPQHKFSTGGRCDTSCYLLVNRGSFFQTWLQSHSGLNQSGSMDPGLEAFLFLFNEIIHLSSMNSSWYFVSNWLYI